MKKFICILLATLFLLSAAPLGVVKASADPPVSGFLDQYPTESVTGYLVADKMPVTVFPLNKDFFYAYFVDAQRTIPAVVRTYEINNVEVGYKDLYLAPDPQNNGSYVRYTVLYHTEGSRLLAIGIYDRGTLDKDGKYVPGTKYYSLDTPTNVASPDTEHSVLGDFYPNKILNDLEAAQAILDYQIENGPFVAGKEYSMFDILNLKH